jgi:hypothetical protein
MENTTTMLKEAAEEQAEEQLGLWRAADRGQLRRVQQLVEQVRTFRKINALLNLFKKLEEYDA